MCGLLPNREDRSSDFGLMKRMKSCEADLATGWVRPDGWNGTWEDIFEEMGWNPANVRSVGWTWPQAGPYKFAKYCGQAIEFEAKPPDNASVTLDGSELVFRAHTQTGYMVSYVDTVSLVDGHLHIRPG